MENIMQQIGLNIGIYTAITALGYLLFKNAIKSKIDASIKYTYNERLTRLEAELKNYNDESSTLRNNILLGLNSRNKLLHEARINAVNELWGTVQKLKKNPLVLSTILTIPNDSKGKNVVIREIFSKITLDDDTVNIDKANLAKPYISKYGWALFEAYSAVHVLSYMQVKILLIDTDSDVDILSSLVKTVSEALPNRKEYLQENGLQGIMPLIPELETALLDELQSILDGTIDDEKHMSAIKNISESANLTEEIIRKTIIPSK